MAQPPADDAAGQKPTKIYALVNYEDAYVQPLILKALKSQLSPSSYSLISSIAGLPQPSSPVLQIVSYESLDFDHLLAHPTTSLGNAYIIRKALIRKHHLSHTVSSWLTKNPESILKHHVKAAVDFELDYAEFLDEALLEAYELHDSFARNAAKEPEEREWWILKPSMSDRGQGIRLFSSEDELRAIFEEWEAEQADSDSDSEPATSPGPPTDPIHNNNADNSIITSQLRHFIAQPYISHPLLLPTHQNRKFHIRTYVLAIGALRVYVYNQMLALFAPLPYSTPGSSPSSASGPNLLAHLTNTCLHLPLPSSSSSISSSTSVSATTDARAPNVYTLASLPGAWKRRARTQIDAVTAAVFEAAARGQMVHFQTRPNAFEVFGLDWLVDARGELWLLEVNAFPDFGQTGEGLRGVVGGLWEGVVGVGVRRWFAGEGKGDGEREMEEERWGMRRVLDLDLGRR